MTIGFIIFDWGDTIMRDIPGSIGPMSEWENVEVIDGADKVLAQLSETYPCYLATNAGDSNAEMVNQALARVNLDKWITKIFTSNELGYKKPDMKFFENICKILEVQPSECCFIGNDLYKDIIPADKVGMKTIWLNNIEGQSKGKFSGIRITSMKDILKLNLI